MNLGCCDEGIVEVRHPNFQGTARGGSDEGVHTSSEGCPVDTVAAPACRYTCGGLMLRLGLQRDDNWEVVRTTNLGVVYGPGLLVRPYTATDGHIWSAAVSSFGVVSGYRISGVEKRQFVEVGPVKQISAACILGLNGIPARVVGIEVTADD